MLVWYQSSRTLLVTILVQPRQRMGGQGSLYECWKIGPVAWSGRMSMYWRSTFSSLQRSPSFSRAKPAEQGGDCGVGPWLPYWFAYGRSGRALARLKGRKEAAKLEGGGRIVQSGAVRTIDLLNDAGWPPVGALVRIRPLGVRQRNARMLP